MLVGDHRNRRRGRPSEQRQRRELLEGGDGGQGRDGKQGKGDASVSPFYWGLRRCYWGLRKNKGEREIKNQSVAASFFTISPPGAMFPRRREVEREDARSSSVRGYTPAWTHHPAARVRRRARHGGGSQKKHVRRVPTRRRCTVFDRLLVRFLYAARL